MTLLPDQTRHINQVQAERFARLSIIVRGMAHQMRPADEDMMQIGLMKLWELIAGDEEREDRYLVASARNAMIDRIRYQAVREREKKVTDLLGLSENAFSDDSIDADIGLDIEDLLSLLPAHMAKAFSLYVFQEYTLEEVARTMHRPVSTVASWIRKAKTLLRKELE